MIKTKINFKLNGEEKIIYVDPLKRLIDILKDDFKLTGTKEGCGEGECGACSVLINNKLVNSCLVTSSLIEGKEIITIEGYSKTEKFNILKNSFEETGSVQCGFCTPGMILASEYLLSNNSHPKEEEIREALEGNLCRCTGYNAIVDAVMKASITGDGLW